MANLKLKGDSEGTDGVVKVNSLLTETQVLFSVPQRVEEKFVSIELR
jgi:hypothetical protein